MKFFITLLFITLLYLNIEIQSLSILRNTKKSSKVKSKTTLKANKSKAKVTILLLPSLSTISKSNVTPLSLEINDDESNLIINLKEDFNDYDYEKNNSINLDMNSEEFMNFQKILNGEYVDLNLIEFYKMWKDSVVFLLLKETSDLKKKIEANIGNSLIKQKNLNITNKDALIYLVEMLFEGNIKAITEKKSNDLLKKYFKNLKYIDYGDFLKIIDFIEIEEKNEESKKICDEMKKTYRVCSLYKKMKTVKEYCILFGMDCTHEEIIKFTKNEVRKYTLKEWWGNLFRSHIYLARELYKIKYKYQIMNFNI
jgi:hypothetical protein